MSILDASGKSAPPSSDVYMLYATADVKPNSLLGHIGKLQSDPKAVMFDVIEIHFILLPTQDGGVGVSHIGYPVGIGTQPFEELIKTGRLFKLESNSPLYRKYFQITSNLTLGGAIPPKKP